MPLSFLQKQIFAWFLGVRGGGGQEGSFYPPTQRQRNFHSSPPPRDLGVRYFFCIGPSSIIWQKGGGGGSKQWFLPVLYDIKWFPTYLGHWRVLSLVSCPALKLCENLLEAHREELASESSPCVCGSQFLYTGRYISHMRSSGVCYDFTLFLLTWVYGSLFSLCLAKNETVCVSSHFSSENLVTF